MRVPRPAKLLAGLVAFALLRARTRRWRREDLIVHGNFRAVESVLTALLSRATYAQRLSHARLVT